MSQHYDTQQRSRVVRAWESFLEQPALFASSGQPPSVRPEIVASWRRSSSSGVDARQCALPHRLDLDPEQQIARAGLPVLERLADQLSGSNACVHLADTDCWIVGRAVGDRMLAAELERLTVMPGTQLSEHVAGTNGLGSVAEAGRQFLVAGPEHYREEYHDYTCAGVPVRHPATGRAAGILVLTCRYADTNPMLLPFLREKARDIGALLDRRVDWRERALFEWFTAVSRRTGRATVCFTEDMHLANASAADLLGVDDRRALLKRARDLPVGDSYDEEVELASGRRHTVRFLPVVVDAQRIGTVALIRQPRGGALERAPSSRNRRPATSRPGLDERLARRATARARVVLVGEPGVGKSAIGALAHARRGVSDPFVTDCADVTPAAEGAWLADVDAALATSGTALLIRHVDLLPLATAARLGVVLDRHHDGAPVVATAESGAGWDGSGHLADRVDVVLEVPPLRERDVELPAVVARILAESATTTGRPLAVEPAAMDALTRFDWPGNLHELRRTLRGVTARRGAGTITLTDLPEPIRSSATAGDDTLSGLERAERDAIARALDEACGNRLAAARALGISRTTLYRKIRHFRLPIPG